MAITQKITVMNWFALRVEGFEPLTSTTRYHHSLMPCDSCPIDCPLRCATGCCAKIDVAIPSRLKADFHYQPRVLTRGRSCHYARHSHSHVPAKRGGNLAAQLAPMANHLAGCPITAFGHDDASATTPCHLTPTRACCDRVSSAADRLRRGLLLRNTPPRRYRVCSLARRVHAGVGRLSTTSIIASLDF